MFTVPNLLSFSRFFLAVAFSACYFVPGLRLISFFLLVTSGITDVLDGFLARKLCQISELGKVLDPAADKFTQLLVFYVFAKDRLISPWLFYAVCLLNLLLAVGGYFFYIRLKNKAIAAKWYGKGASVLFFVSMVLTFLFNLSGNGMGENASLAVTLCFSLTVGLMAVSAVSYVICAVKANKVRKDRLCGRTEA